MIEWYKQARRLYHRALALPVVGVGVRLSTPWVRRVARVWARPVPGEIERQLLEVSLMVAGLRDRVERLEKTQSANRPVS